MADQAVTEPVVPAQPTSLQDILADIKGFGLEDFEELIILQSSTRTLQIKLSNIATEEELIAHLAVEEHKGYLWIQNIKCEIISRAVSWINGIDIRSLTAEQRLVEDPNEPGAKKDIQVVLRGIIKSWGQEYMQVLWKVLMVHSQNIENRLMASFPDAAVMTEVERRLTERAQRELEEVGREVIQDQVSRLFEDDPKEIDS